MPYLKPVQISVVIRSMARACLKEALSSFVATEIPLELVLVNACGGVHDVPDLPNQIALRLLNQGGKPLGRAEAANLGLSNSTSQFILFCDDDDLIDPNHLTRLAVTLTESPAAVAAYTGVRLVNGQGEVLREVNEPWEADRLLGMNYLPIHAVMFRAAEVQGKLSFDTNLDLMEDWDFWRQLAALGPFVRLPGCSATYRLGLGASGLSENRDLDAMLHAHAKVLKKIERDDRVGISRAFFWFDTALAHLQIEKATLVENLSNSNAYIAALENRVREEESKAIRHQYASEANLAEKQSLLYQLGLLSEKRDGLAAELVAVQDDLALAQANQAETSAELVAVQDDLAKSQKYLCMILESRSWKLTAPLRVVAQKIRLREQPND